MSHNQMAPGNCIKVASESECGSRVVGKLERLKQPIENIANINSMLSKLIAELDAKIGMTPDQASTVSGGIPVPPDAKQPSIETLILHLQTQEDRLSRYVGLLSKLIKSL